MFFYSRLAAIIVIFFMAQECFGQITCETSGPPLSTSNCASLIQPYCDRLTISAVSFNADDQLFRCSFNPTTNQNCIIRAGASTGLKTAQKADNVTCAGTLFAIAGECPQGGFGTLNGSPLTYAINAEPGTCNLLLKPQP